MKFEFALDVTPKGSTQTLRTSLMQVKKTTGKVPKQLKNPFEMPEELEYVWEWWLRSFTGDVLTFTELHHWGLLSKTVMVPWEVELVKTIDRIYWSVHHV